MRKICEYTYSLMHFLCFGKWLAPAEIELQLRIFWDDQFCHDFDRFHHDLNKVIQLKNAWWKKPKVYKIYKTVFDSYKNLFKTTKSLYLEFFFNMLQRLIIKDY